MGSFIGGNFQHSSIYQYIMRSSLCLALTVLLSVITYGKNTDPSDSTTIAKRVYITKKLGELTPLQIDGQIEEQAWAEVPWSSDYTELTPDQNSAPTEQTRFKILYDHKNMYIAVRCFDSEPDKIVKRLSRRDGFEGDWVEFNIDSYHDKRTAFSFTVSAAGVKGDEFISNNNNFDRSWNPIWYVKTNIDDEGWTAEIRIPLSQLRFSNDPDQVWGIQSTRRFFRNAERSTWQRVPQNAPGWVSEFGELRGLKDLEPQKQLELQPYTVSKFETYEAVDGNPFRTGRDGGVTGGLDAKIGVTNDLTLDLTVNPDFGQVEADPAAIALDGFQIFFQEQRPFFVENKNIFDYQLGNNQDNLFYSRRIGRSPQGSVQDGNVAYSDSPENTTILGAAKFSGKTKSGWSLGILESLTAREFATTINAEGEEGEVQIEPLTNYLVTRAQKDFNENNSFVGVIFTATNRESEPNLNFLHRAAFSSGIDFRHNWKDRKYFVKGNLIMSNIQGSEEAILQTQQSIVHLFNRVDASHVEVDPTRTSLTGTGGSLELGKAGGGRWRYNGGVEWRSPELDLNDIGFLRQADEIRQYAGVRYRTLQPFGKFRRLSVGANQYSNFDFEGNFNGLGVDLNTNMQFESNWWIESGTGYQPANYANAFLRGGPRWRFSDEHYEYFFFGSDRRKKMSFNLGQVYGWSGQNNSNFQRYVLRLRYQPFDALSLSMETEYQRRPNKTQYVSASDYGTVRRYILGNIDQKTLFTSFRMNYNINPNLSVQYYGQPYISRGEYSGFNYVNDATAGDLYKRINLYNDDQVSLDETRGQYLIDENTDGTADYSFAKPDFNFVQFRSNLVLRWEYIPGSEVFLVWSQGVTEFGDPGEPLFQALDTNLVQNQPDNIFLLKATYRLRI